MFQDVPISAYLLCYGPLALMIIGFVVFALRTDADSRRTYLRRASLKPESELGDEPRPVVTERVQVETPSGARVTLTPPDATE